MELLDNEKNRQKEIVCIEPKKASDIDLCFHSRPTLESSLCEQSYESFYPVAERRSRWANRVLRVTSEIL